ncbi:MAG: SAM-dependent methyltransferase [Jiangellaceae bacterium]
MSEGDRLPRGVDPTVPNIARMYDYALGGKDNLAVDRAAMEQIFGVVPYGPRPALENRAFLGRTVRFLTEAGIRQFLDLGSGLPTQGNVHEVAHEVAPETRGVYIDYDPVAISHSRALLSGVDNFDAAQADMRRPDEILSDPTVTAMIDFTRPTAVLLAAVLHSVTDDEDPAGIVGRLREAMAPGSYVVISHITSHEQPAEYVTHVRKVFDQAREPMVPRSRDEILRFFDGFELVEPGLVAAPDWRPEEADNDDQPPTGFILGGVGVVR